MGKELPCYGGFCFAYQSSVRRTGFALRGHDISDIGKRMAREAEDTLNKPAVSVLSSIHCERLSLKQKEIEKTNELV